MQSDLERTFETHIRSLRLPEPRREYRFHPKRRWRFDFAFPEHRLAVECEGGIWSRGRHVRGKGFEQDCKKYNAAAELGWRVLRYTPDMIKSGEAINQLERVLDSVGLCGKKEK